MWWNLNSKLLLLVRRKKNKKQNKTGTLEEGWDGGVWRGVVEEPEGRRQQLSENEPQASFQDKAGPGLDCMSTFLSHICGLWYLPVWPSTLPMWEQQEASPRSWGHPSLYRLTGRSLFWVQHEQGSDSTFSQIINPGSPPRGCGYWGRVPYIGRQILTRGAARKVLDFFSVKQQH